MERGIKGYWLALVVGIVAIGIHFAIGQVSTAKDEPIDTVIEVREVGVPLVVSANDKIIEATRVLKDYQAKRTEAKGPLAERDVVNCVALYDLLEAARIAYSENCPGP